MLHSYKALLTVLFLQATISMCKSKIQRMSSQKSGACIVQNFYGFGSLQDVVKRLNQMTQKLDDLDKKLSSCTGTTSECKTVPKNCAYIYKCGLKKSGVYKIDPDGRGLFSAFCDQTTDGGGWTVIQRRLDGSTNFYRGWSEYKHGFGNLKREYWLGLDKIHRLTHQQTYKLRVDLEDWNRKTAYAVYSLFGVADEKHKYKLSLGTYSGTAGDSLAYHRGMAFSTMDRDNDQYKGNCAQNYKGGWWYNACHYSNLNGLYLPGLKDPKGVDWRTFKNHHYSNKKAVMMIRPVNFGPH